MTARLVSHRHPREKSRPAGRVDLDLRFGSEKSNRKGLGYEE